MSRAVSAIMVYVTEEDRECDEARRQRLFAARAPREQTIIVTGKHGQPVERTLWTDTHFR